MSASVYECGGSGQGPTCHQGQISPEVDRFRESRLRELTADKPHPSLFADEISGDQQRSWRVTRDGQSFVLQVASSASRGTSVIASVNGRAHWIDVRKGPTVGENVSVRGQIAADQLVVKRASDEIREGTPLGK